MKEIIDGTCRGVVVECKHTDTVGRPVVQKLHSAIATFDFEGPKRGMIPAQGFVHVLTRQGTYRSLGFRRRIGGHRRSGGDLYSVLRSHYRLNRELERLW